MAAISDLFFHMQYVPILDKVLLWRNKRHTFKYVILENLKNKHFHGFSKLLMNFMNILLYETLHPISND